MTISPSGRGSSGRKQHRAGKLLACSALFLGTSFAAPALATAAPAPAAAGPVAYGSNGCTIGLPQFVYHRGERLPISGTCGTTDDLLTFTVASTPQVIGHVTANERGDYSVVLSVPTDLADGTHTLTVTDADGALDASTTFEVVDGTASSSTGSAAGGATGGGSSGGLAFTGTDVLATTLVGAGAIGVGGLLVLSSRKRRRKGLGA